MVSVTRNIRRKEYEPDDLSLSLSHPFSLSLSLSLPTVYSLSFFFFSLSLSLSLSEQRASVCEVCQGPPHSAIPFSKLKVKSNSLCCVTRTCLYVHVHTRSRSHIHTYTYVHKYRQNVKRKVREKKRKIVTVLTIFLSRWWKSWSNSFRATRQGHMADIWNFRPRERTSS